MKYRLVLIILLGCIAGLVVAVRWGDVLPAQTPPFPLRELRIGVDASLPPFAYVVGDELVGLEIEIGRALGAELGLPVRFVNIGIDGLVDALLTGQVDVLLSAFVAEPWRTGDVIYTRPYFDAGLVLLSLAESPVATMRDLPGQALAYEYGSLADNEARLWLRRIPAFETRPYELPDVALDAVRLGEADAALVDAVTACLYLADYPTWSVSRQYVTHQQLVMAVDLHRGTTFQAIDRALGRIMARGVVDGLLQAWLGGCYTEDDDG
ncbi:MAG: transporter substrate-binding domain-containing protein [Anaerolineae bacterium]